MSQDTYRCPKCGGLMRSFEYNPEFGVCILCGYEGKLE